jgi:sugar/nucleoside kinase (ribokinase family)
LRYDLTVVGHIVRDHINHGGRTQGPRLGGPCIYSGLAARALHASVLVVSKVGQDFRREEFDWLAKRGISNNRIRVSPSPTTCFTISYHGSGRRMHVIHRCDPLGPSDVEDLPRTRAVHLGPVLDEVSERVALRVAEREFLVSLDPQGYTRRIGRTGTVSLRKWNDRNLLKKLKIMKVSENELRVITGGNTALRHLSKIGPEIVLLTRGAKGTVVCSRDEGVYKIPAYPTRVRDPTGAGDALVGGFLISWVRTGELLWSSAVGSAIASLVVERLGKSKFGSVKQIEMRAKKVLDGTARVRG